MLSYKLEHLTYRRILFKKALSLLLTRNQKRVLMNATNETKKERKYFIDWLRIGLIISVFQPVLNSFT